jgi:hypothetical protein
MPVHTALRRELSVISAALQQYISSFLMRNDAVQYLDVNPELLQLLICVVFSSLFILL